MLVISYRNGRKRRRRGVGRVSIGLRWDINPAPGNLKGPSPYTVDQTTNLATTKLAPAGTPLWNAVSSPLAELHAPRLAYRHNGEECVFRAFLGDPTISTLSLITRPPAMPWQTHSSA